MGKALCCGSTGLFSSRVRGKAGVSYAPANQDLSKSFHCVGFFAESAFGILLKLMTFRSRVGGRVEGGGVTAQPQTVSSAGSKSLKSRHFL